MLAKAIVTKILYVNNHITEEQKYNVEMPGTVRVNLNQFHDH